MSRRARSRTRAAHVLGRLLPDAAVEPAMRAATRRGGTLLAWAVIVASPLATLAGLLLLRPTPPPPLGGDVPVAQRAPQGWAEMYVRSWLSASRDDSAGLEAFYPAGMKTQRTVGTQVPVDTATVSVTSPRAGEWSVVVAVNLLTQQPNGKHTAKLTCVQVSLLEATTPAGAAYAAAALPSPVACPATLEAPALGYPETAELTGPIGQSVLGFLTSYLAGQGGLDRYTSPGSPLAPVAPPPYAAVQLAELRTHEKFEPGQAARPLDRTDTHVLARAWGYDATGQVTVLDYALTLAARAGRWEISQIDPVPLLAAPPSPTGSPAASVPNGSSPAPAAPPRTGG
ncbi:conjugal transfer protein [Amycolatopsis samaneae]|uniref:Conjugal transfer protein n=1 Tax=Amycolatopsis samaneae TaxID=664691 RepID=A0ABW5GVB9_9PSEU